MLIKILKSFILLSIMIICICNVAFAKNNLKLQIENAKLITEYNSDTSADDIEIDKDLKKLYEPWDDNMFNNTSYQYSHKIARISAMLSEAAYTESKIENLLLNEFNFSKLKFYNYNYSKSMKIGYDGTNCFSVAHKGEGNSAIVVISVRGTKEFSEMLGDAFKYDFINGQYLHSMNNVAVYDHIYDFYEQIKIGVENYFAENSNLQKVKNLKILITGHSLGGAAANCYAADLIANIDNNKLNSNLEKNNVYTYTFGAIKVFKKRLDQNAFDTISNFLNGVSNYSEGYMNIFNIYNHYDSFGPHGNYSWTKASAPQQKFGHTFIYNDEKLHFEEINESHVWALTMEDVNKGWYDLFFRGSIFKFLENMGKLVDKPENLFGTFNNHNMTNYMAALNFYDFSKNANANHEKSEKNDKVKSLYSESLDLKKNNDIENSIIENEYKVKSEDNYDEIFEMSYNEVAKLKQLRANSPLVDGSLFLSKNNKYYSLMSIISKEKSEKYNLGFSTKKNDEFYLVYNNFPDEQDRFMYDHYRQTFGKIPLIKLSKNDIICGFDKLKLYLTPATFEGYTIKCIPGGLNIGSYGVVISFDEYVLINFPFVSEFTMTDSSDNKIPLKQGYAYSKVYSYPDLSNLKKDEIYTLSWFEGTDYKEYNVQSDSYIYKIDWLENNSFDRYSKFKYQINGKLNKSGYASFDLSQVPKGVYYLDTGCFVEIE